MTHQMSSLGHDEASYHEAMLRHTDTPDLAALENVWRDNDSCDAAILSSKAPKPLIIPNLF